MPKPQERLSTPSLALAREPRGVGALSTAVTSLCDTGVCVGGSCVPLAWEIRAAK